MMNQIRLCKFILSVGVFAFLLAGTSVSYVRATNPSSVFGVVDGYYRPGDLHDLGVSWQRITFPWYALQSTKGGSLNFHAVPAADGIQVVGLIKGTPSWASASGLLGAVPDGLELPYNDPRNLFGLFVTELVRHYAALGLHDWIVWNEPDIRPGEGNVEFEGGVSDYFHLLKVAYLAAHAVDPLAHVLIAGMSWWRDSNAGRAQYLQRLLSTIQTDPAARQNNWYFDGLCSHIYFTTESVWLILNANRAILSDFGLPNKAIWLTEFNASPRRDPAAAIKALFQVSLSQEADFIVQASALALAAHVERLAVYRLYDNDFTPGRSEPWGLIRADGSRRPAYNAYQQAIRLFDSAQRVVRYSTTESSAVVLSMLDHSVYVLWSNTFKAGQFLIPLREAENSVTITDAVGMKAGVMISRTHYAVIDAPGAEKIDSDRVIVAGAVRLVILPGAPREVLFQTADGRTFTLS